MAHFAARVYEPLPTWCIHSVLAGWNYFLVYIQLLGKMQYKVRSERRFEPSINLSRALQKQSYSRNWKWLVPCTCKLGTSALKSSLIVWQDPAQKIKSKARDHPWFQSIMISCTHVRESPDAGVTALKEQTLDYFCLSINCMCVSTELSSTEP